jgi:hypothetical protein
VSVGRRRRSKNRTPAVAVGVLAAAAAGQAPAPRNPVYAARYQRTKSRLGRRRGPSIARVDIAREFTEASHPTQVRAAALSRERRPPGTG